MKTFLFRAAAVLLIALSFVTNASALTCYLLTQDNKLVTVNSANPGAAGAAVAITNIAAGFELIGIDIRTTTQTINPANPGVGSLWALATDATDTNYQLYVINPATHAATPIGGVFTGLTSGGFKNGWFFGFDPGTDRIRIIASKNNYELNPNNPPSIVKQGDLTAFNFNLSGSAFTTASFGAASSIYFVAQEPNDTIHTSANIASGVTQVVGDTGLNFSVADGGALDISAGTTLLATAIGGTANLYNINRATGAATLIGAIGGNPTVRALAILPTSFPPTLSVTVKISGKKKITTTKTSLKIKGTASCGAGITLVQYKVGKGKFKTAKGTTNWNFKAKLKPGTNKIKVKATGGNDVVSSPAKVTVKVVTAQ
jgi:hypothetical protein